MCRAQGLASPARAATLKNDKPGIAIEGPQGPTNRRRERGFAVAPAHAQGRVVRLAKCPGQKTPLPGEQLERLPGVAALADDQAGDYSRSASRQSACDASAAARKSSVARTPPKADTTQKRHGVAFHERHGVAFHARTRDPQHPLCGPFGDTRRPQERAPFGMRGDGACLMQKIGGRNPGRNVLPIRRGGAFRQLVRRGGAFRQLGQGRISSRQALPAV